MKRLICLLLAVVFVFSATACGKKDKATGSTNSDVTSSDADSIISDLQNSEEEESSDPDGFDNTDEKDETPTPGDDDNSSDDSNDQASPEDESKYDYDPSLLSAEDNQFYYEGNGYAFGITSDGQEVIAFRDEDGLLVDAIRGAGEYQIFDGSLMFMYAGIKNFERTLVDGEMSLSIEYNLTGLCASNSVVKTNYVFHRNSITVTASVDTVSPHAKITSGNLTRTYLNKVKKTEKDYDYEWIYPENGDYPYQKSSAIYLKQWFDDDHVMYLFNRDINVPEYVYLESYPETRFNLVASNEKGFSYNLIYDIVLENASTTDNLHYEARFEGYDSEFAVGISPVKPNNDNSTVFVGDSVDLNLNVTNLMDYDLTFSIRYDVRDYYGNIVDSGIFKNSTVFHESEANRRIKISGNYGMYWINLYVVSPLSKYYECYPLMLAKDYDFKYMSDSPFGIDADHAYTYAELETNISVLNKLGIRRVRSGQLPKGYKDNDRYELLKKYGIRCFEYVDIKSANKKGLDSLLKTWNSKKSVLDYMMMNNELDGEILNAKENEIPSAYKPQAMLDMFKNKILGINVSDLTGPFVKKNNIPVAFIATCHANDLVTPVMYQTGVWDASTVIDTHVYCYPKIPDKYKITTGTLHSIEYSLERMEKAFNNYGGAGEKLYAIGETGYPTAPESLSSTCIRTQADFNTRTAFLSFAHGVDYVNYYCLLDRTGYYKGSGEWNEMNFGAFLCYDYYGILKPKPWAAAYATLTRQLDGMTSVKTNSKYDQENGGTVRAFTVNNKRKEDLVVAWSNVYMIPNTSSAGSVNNIRQPNLPWNNQWTLTEKVKFDATEKVVTVVDTMGNSKKYTAKNGKVTIPLTGSPVYIYGVK